MPKDALLGIFGIGSSWKTGCSPPFLSKTALPSISDATEDFSPNEDTTDMGSVEAGIVGTLKKTPARGF